MVRDVHILPSYIPRQEVFESVLYYVSAIYYTLGSLEEIGQLLNLDRRETE
jgi:hypothetical protein